MLNTSKNISLKLLVYVHQYMCLFSLLFIHTPSKSQVAWAPNKQPLINIATAESLSGTSSLTENS